VKRLCLILQGSNRNAQLTITFSIAFSSQTSLDDSWVALLPSSETLVLDDIVTWEDPWVQLSAFDFDMEQAEIKGVLTSFKESILRRLSKRSLHIWSLNHSLWVWRVALISFISCGSSTPSFRPIANYHGYKNARSLTCIQNNPRSNKAQNAYVCIGNPTSKQPRKW
jgi:hypothetical protein